MPVPSGASARGAAAGAGEREGMTSTEIGDARVPTRARPASVASSAATSSVFANRRCGSFCRQRATSDSSAAGTPGRRRPRASGSRSMTAARTWAGVSRRNVGRPVTISCRIKPSEN